MATKTTKTADRKLKAVVVRTYSAGVHYGYLVSRSGQEVVLERARRIWSWNGANTLHEVALRGVGSGSRVSEKVSSITLTQAIEIIACTPEGAAALDAAQWS